MTRSVAVALVLLGVSALLAGGCATDGGPAGMRTPSADAWRSGSEPAAGGALASLPPRPGDFALSLAVTDAVLDASGQPRQAHFVVEPDRRLRAAFGASAGGSWPAPIAKLSPRQMDAVYRDAVKALSQTVVAREPMHRTGQAALVADSSLRRSEPLATAIYHVDVTMGGRRLRWTADPSQAPAMASLVNRLTRLAGAASNESLMDVVE